MGRQTNRQSGNGEGIPTCQPPYADKTKSILFIQFNFHKTWEGKQNRKMETKY